LGLDADDSGSTAETAAPVEPGEADGARCAPAIPTSTVHARQSASKDVEGVKPAVLEQIGAANRLEKTEPQEQENVGREIDRVLGKALRRSVGGVGDDGGDAGRRLRQQKEVADEVQRKVARGDVTRDDGKAALPQG